MKISDGTLCSRIKGANVKLDEDVRTSIVGFRLGNEKNHLGIKDLHKFSIYQACLRDPRQPRDY